MLRYQLVAQHRYIVCSSHYTKNNNHYHIFYRCLSQVTNPKHHHHISSNNYVSIHSKPLLSSSTYLRLQKRSFTSIPSAPPLNNIIFKGLFIYLLLYFSYKFFIKKEDRAPRLEILENHCYSPFHINSILSLIYPKLLGIFQQNSNIYIPSKYSKRTDESNKHDIESLIGNTENNYNIDIHQKIWIDSDNVQDIKRYNKFFDKSFLHSFNFEIENLSFDQINFEITDIVKTWFNNILSHSFISENNYNPIDDIDFVKWEQEQKEMDINTKEKRKRKTEDMIKPGLRMTLANTLKFDETFKYKFDTIDHTEVPLTEIAYFNNDNNNGSFNEYLKSDINDYKYMKYQNHEIVIIPFENNDNLSLILSLPILDYNFILNDVENKKYEKNDKYIKWSIHPHDLHKIFDSKQDDIDNIDDKMDINLDDTLHDEKLQLFIPKMDKEFSNEMKDHHVVAVGLNVFWLPLYYGNICLKSIDCKSYLNMNTDNIKFELLSIAYFDQEKRVWAAMRWKYGLRDIALKMNWYNLKQKLKQKFTFKLWKRKKNHQNHDDKQQQQQQYKTLVFDRPFDVYLYDSCNQIVYASGTVSS